MMRRFSPSHRAAARAFASLLLAGLMPLAAAAQTASGAEADAIFPPNSWNICNETSFVLRAATAAMQDGKMTPRGWDRIRPGACISKNPPPTSPRYVFAESEALHTGGVREWKGKTKLCVDETDFVADATRSCALQDMEMQAYLQVDPKERTTTFIEPDNFGDKASTAGMQRLLKDNGYKIARIDGLSGRRTARTLNRFLKDNEIERGITDGQKFDALIKGAMSVQSSIGLTLCNETSHKVWSAIAYQNDGEWESRGWWPIETGDCARNFTSALENTNAHFYALQEQPIPEGEETAPKDKRLRTLTAKPRQFCVAEGVFSAVGNEYCADRGYTPVNFRALPTDAPGLTLKLKDSDFAGPSSTGLRR